MKLKSNFISYDTKDESLQVPAGSADFSGIVRETRLWALFWVC